MGCWLVLDFEANKAYMFLSWEEEKAHTKANEIRIKYVEEGFCDEPSHSHVYVKEIQEEGKCLVLR